MLYIRHDELLLYVVAIEYKLFAIPLLHYLLQPWLHSSQFVDVFLKIMFLLGPVVKLSIDTCNLFPYYLELTFYFLHLLFLFVIGRCVYLAWVTE